MRGSLPVPRITLKASGTYHLIFPRTALRGIAWKVDRCRPIKEFPRNTTEHGAWKLKAYKRLTILKICLFSLRLVDYHAYHAPAVNIGFAQTGIHGTK
jgi:hypothetical protein